MKKIGLLLLLLMGFGVSVAQTPHTQLTGTLNNPDGTGYNGHLYLSISSPSSVSSVSPCGGPAQIVPNQAINIAIVNGVMANYTVADSPTVYNGAPKIFGSDCTIPVSQPYDAVLRDANGNIKYTTQWIIVGATQDVGTVQIAPAVPASNGVVQIQGYGPPSGNCAASTSYLQLDAASGSNLWMCVGSSWVHQTGIGAIAFSNIPGSLACSQLPALSGAVTLSSCSASLNSTGVTPATYGGGGTVPIVTVGADGRVTSASTTTVTASAGTLGGTTLASNVTAAPGITSVAGGTFGDVAFRTSGVNPGNVLILNSASQIPDSTLSGRFPILLGSPTASGKGTIANAFAACGTTGCDVLRDAAYTGIEALPPLTINYLHVKASTAGSTNDTYHNSDASNPNYGPHQIDCYQDTAMGFTGIAAGGFGGPQQKCFNVYSLNTEPGKDIGTTPGGGRAGGWAVDQTLASASFIFGKAIAGHDDWSLLHLGAGDTHSYGYIFSASPCVDQSCEFHENRATNGGEIDGTYVGTVVTTFGDVPGGANATKLFTNCVAGCQAGLRPLQKNTDGSGGNATVRGKSVSNEQGGLQGVGRYLIEQNPVFTSSLVSCSDDAQSQGLGLSRCTLSSALPSSMVSTAVGVLANACLVPELPNDASTTINCPLTVTSGTYAAGTLIAISGTLHEQTTINSIYSPPTWTSAGIYAANVFVVYSGNVYQSVASSNNITPGTNANYWQLLGSTSSTVVVSTNFRHSHPVGSTVFQGNTQASNTTGSPNPSTTGTAMHMLANDVDGEVFAEQNGHPFTNSGGTVTLYPAGISSATTGGEVYALIGQYSIILRSANFPAFNGPCFNVTFVTDHLTCTQASSTGLTDNSNDEGITLPLKYPIDVLGAYDTTHIAVSMYRAGYNINLDLGNVNFDQAYINTPLTNSGGTVAIHVDPNSPSLQLLRNQPVITIKGSTTAAFNGQCLNAHIDPTGTFIQCTQAASTGLTDSGTSGVFISVGDTSYGNTRFALHNMCEVLDVRDPTINDPKLQVDGYFTCEPNQIIATNGKAVEESHHYAQNYVSDHNALMIHNPMQSQFNVGIYSTLQGGAFGSSNPQQSMYAYNQGNGTPMSQYVGQGGTRIPAGFIAASGVWSVGLYMSNAPYPSMSPVIHIDCPYSDYRNPSTTGCNDVSYSYRPLWLRGKNNYDYQSKWVPSTNTYSSIINGATSSVWTQSPAGIVVQGGLSVDNLTVTGGFSIGSLTLTGDLTSSTIHTSNSYISSHSYTPELFIGGVYSANTTGLFHILGPAEGGNNGLFIYNDSNVNIKSTDPVHVSGAGAWDFALATSIAFAGPVTVPTVASSDNSTNAASTAFVKAQITDPAIPVPPAGAQVFTNLQDAAGGTWVPCAQACAGGGPGITSITNNVSSPSLSGHAMKVTLQNQNAPGSLSINAPGTGYVVGNTFTITQAGCIGASGTVSAIGAGGAVTAATVSGTSGQGCTVANGLPTVATSGSGTSLTVNITMLSAPANSLYYKQIGCPTTPNGCVPLKDLQMVEEYDQYIPAGSNFQAVENDPDLFDGTKEWFNSRQADSATGMWRLWNMGANSWVTTSYPQTLLTAGLGSWHHIREYSTISRTTGFSYYQGFEYDGVTVWSHLNQAFPPAPLTGTPTLNVQVQIDLNASAGFTAQSFYMDNMKLSVW